MIKRLLLIVLTCIEVSNVIGQSDIWPIEFGEYEVGYKDTIIYDSAEIFQYHTINTYKPYFIHIWYPTNKKLNSCIIKYDDYWVFDADSNENVLIKKTRDLYNNEAFGTSLTPTIISNQDLKVYKNAPELQLDSELIIYHHGSQGVGIENNRLCEFLASHGYTVIAPIFTLPSDMVNKLIPSTEFKTKFNLKDLTQEVMKDIEIDMNNAEINNLDFILEYASKNFKKEIIGIGHSRGAQKLLLSDKDSINRLQKIITYHTTYEDHLTNEICKIHPFDCMVIDTNIYNFDTPKFFFAQRHYLDSTLTSPNFDFYNRFTNSSYFELTCPIEHNAYVYDWLLYQTGNNLINKNRIEEYNRILHTTLEVIKNIMVVSDEHIIVSKPD